MRTKFQYQRNPQFNCSSELGQLFSIIEKSIKENRNIYRQLCQNDHSFSYQLYTPISHNGVSPQFLKPLLLKQIDQLMTEKDQLLKQQELMKLKTEMASGKVVEAENKNSYSVMRDAWTKFDNKGVPSSQHIDNLNKIVGMVKKNINLIIESQKKTEQGKDLFRPVIFGQEIHNSERAREQKIKENMENLRMKNEDLQGRVYELKIQIENKNKKIQRLESQLSVVGKQIKKSVEMFNSNINRIKSLEQTKNELENKIEYIEEVRSKISENTKVYDSINGDFTIKIQSQTLQGLSVSKTKKTLSEIMLFLSPEKIQIPLFSGPTPDFSLQFNHEKEDPNMIPELDLSTARSSGNVFTERYTPKLNRFISQKTPRSNLNRSHQVQGENNEECKSYGSSKKFMRKGDYGPITTDRYKNEKSLVCDIKVDLLGDIKKKL